jgi:acid phosphatase
MKLHHLAVALVLPPLAAVGCAPGSRDVSCRPISSGSTHALTSAQSSPFKGTVFTIVMENHSTDQIIGANGPPYINSLVKQGAVAARYEDPQIHPSEPNYLWMTSGENFGVTSDGDPIDNHVSCTAHIADQIEAAGLTWKAYQESMGAPCGTDQAYPYMPKHNPFVYYDDINGWDGTQFTKPARCTNHVVDYSQFDADLQSGKLPKYVFITPNMIDDMHDGSVQDGDNWLSHEVPKILASDAWKNGGVLFLTWDEGSSLGNDHPPMIVVSPLAKQGYVSTGAYNTSSYLKTVQAILGLDALPCDPQPESVQTMADLFTVSLPN